MSIYTKICGINDTESGLLCSNLGADALGFASAIDLAFEFSKERVGDKIMTGLQNIKLLEEGDIG